MNLVKKLYFRQIAVIVALSMLVIGSIPAESMAYVVGSEAAVSASTRAADMEAVQRVLESKLVAGKLSLSGLSAQEINARLDNLSDAELHQFSRQIDSLYPGGDALGAVIAVLIIAILVLVLLKLADRKIIIR